MNTDDIAAILGLAGGSPYISQETIYGGAVTPDMYTPNGMPLVYFITSTYSLSSGVLGDIQE